MWLSLRIKPICQPFVFRLIRLSRAGAKPLAAYQESGGVSSFPFQGRCQSDSPVGRQSGQRRPNPSVNGFKGALYASSNLLFDLINHSQCRSFVRVSFPAFSKSSIPRYHHRETSPASRLPAYLHALFITPIKYPVSLRSAYTTCQATMTNAPRASRVPSQRGLALSRALASTFPVSTHTLIMCFSLIRLRERLYTKQPHLSINRRPGSFLSHHGASPARPAHARNKMLRRLMNPTSYVYYRSRRIPVGRFDGTVHFYRVQLFLPFPADRDPNELPSTISPISIPVRGSLLDAESPITFPLSSRSNSHPTTAPELLLPTPATCSQARFDTSATYVEGLSRQSLLVSLQYPSSEPFHYTSATSSSLNDSSSFLRDGSRYPQSSSTHPGVDAQGCTSYLKFAWLLC